MRAEFDAFKAALSTPPQLVGKVFEGTRTTDAGEPPRENYVVVQFGIPRFNDERYTAPQVYGSTRFYEVDVRFVATSHAGVMTLADAALKHLLRLVLTVPGRVCEPIREDRTANDLQGVQFDKTARLFYLDTTFTFISRSA